MIDTGSGFAETELAHVFERFYKGAQGAHGLGLAIVLHVCEANGWQATARNAAEGGGEVLIEMGAVGEVIKVIRDAPGGVAYHIHFDSLPGRVLQIPEGILEPHKPAE